MQEMVEGAERFAADGYWIIFIDYSLYHSCLVVTLRKTVVSRIVEIAIETLKALILLGLLVQWLKCIECIEDNRKKRAFQWWKRMQSSAYNTF